MSDWFFWVGLLAVVVLLAALGLTAALRRAEQRREAEWEERRLRLERDRFHERADDLAARFGSEIREKILRHEIWLGQTEVMLIESRGAPADQEEQVTKTKTKRVYKYDRQGGNRFGLRVTFEDGVVVGWEGRK